MSQKNMRLAVSPNLIKLSYPNSNLYDRHVRLGSEFLIYAKDNLFSCFIVILRKGAVELDFGHNFLETVQMLIKKIIGKQFYGRLLHVNSSWIFQIRTHIIRLELHSDFSPSVGRTTWSHHLVLKSVPFQQILSSHV